MIHCWAKSKHHDVVTTKKRKLRRLQNTPCIIKEKEALGSSRRVLSDTLALSTMSLLNQRKITYILPWHSVLAKSQRKSSTFESKLHLNLKHSYSLDRDLLVLGNEYFSLSFWLIFVIVKTPYLLLALHAHWGLSPPHLLTEFSRATPHILSSQGGRGNPRDRPWGAGSSPLLLTRPLEWRGFRMVSDQLIVPIAFHRISERSYSLCWAAIDFF